jgi:oligopeptide/dipeptide ABC transporter ATP-binding protein
VSLLELQDVEVTYDRRGREPVRAVAGVSLLLEPGQIVGLVGESGCGKSTLAKAVVGLVPASAGKIFFEGREVGPLTRRARPRDLVRLQMVFQNPFSSLNPRRTIGAQLAEAMLAAGLTRRAGRGRVAELLELVGLSAGAAERYPHQFSGGQRQRIAVARALAAQPSVIVLDEPLSSLDASAQAQLANVLVDLARTLEIGLLLISHDLAIVRYAADAISVMYLGRIVEDGPAAATWETPLHPYTEALIGAVPHADGAGTLPEALPGEVPDPARPPAGCRFHPRCPYRFDRCTVDEPPLLHLEDGRMAACWLHDADRTPLPPHAKAAAMTNAQEVAP